MKTTIVILDNIRSTYNVGSIFRTCDGAGVSKIFVCGVTPAPVDRFGRVRKDIAKVALGAETSVPWEHVATTQEAIEKLKKENVRIVAVEQSEGAENFKKFSAPESVAFVFGEETKGLTQEILALCDDIIEIPMHGAKESLNVAVVAGIILFGNSVSKRGNRVSK
jgi:tRNA G18 (ribose-2'-O)-methylase SpoU